LLITRTEPLNAGPFFLSDAFQATLQNCYADEYVPLKTKVYCKFIKNKTYIGKRINLIYKELNDEYVLNENANPLYGMLRHI
jgi:hypothetical protein